jgi:hypothetical protein
MNGLTLIVIMSCAFGIFFLHRKLKNVKLYHQMVKRPICRVNVRLQRSFSTALSESEILERKIALKRNDISYSEYSDNPYERLIELPTQGKLKFCYHKIREVKKRAMKYYPYTNGRLKREDVYELCIYKREIKELEQKISQTAK